jgi:Leucine-rich repeat (LRR) protein
LTELIEQYEKTEDATLCLTDMEDATLRLAAKMNMPSDRRNEDAHAQMELLHSLFEDGLLCIKILDLKGSDVRRGLEVLAASWQNLESSTLLHIDATGTGVDSDDVAKLTGEMLACLEVLSLGKCNIQQIPETLKTALYRRVSGIIELDLSENNIDNLGVDQLGKALASQPNTSLKILKLSKNAFSSNVESLALVLSKCQLKYLDLSSNKISDVEPLAAALVSGTCRLEVLNLSGNPDIIVNKGVAKLSARRGFYRRSLASNTSLRELHLGQNDISCRRQAGPPAGDIARLLLPASMRVLDLSGSGTRITGKSHENEITYPVVVLPNM